MDFFSSTEQTNITFLKDNELEISTSMSLDWGYLSVQSGTLIWKVLITSNFFSQDKQLEISATEHECIKFFIEDKKVNFSK